MAGLEWAAKLIVVTIVGDVEAVDNGCLISCRKLRGGLWADVCEEVEGLGVGGDLVWVVWFPSARMSLESVVNLSWYAENKILSILNRNWPFRWWV